MSYHLEGRLLEVCNCRVLCPCWIGEDPDFGTCDTIVAWLGWRYAFAPLALGPLVGVIAMARLRASPASARLAGGRR